MSNCPVISGTNRVGGFALSMQYATAVTPLDNLRTPWRSRVAKFTATSDRVHIRGSAAGLIPMSLIALIGHDMGYSRTVQIKLYSAANQGGTLLYDSGIKQSDNGDGTSIGDKRDFWHFFGQVNAQSFLIILSGLIAGEQFSIQGLWVDNATQFVRGFDSRSLAFRLFEMPKLLTTSAGSSVPESARKRIRQFNWVFPAIDDVDRMLLELLEVSAVDQLFYVISMPEGGKREKLLYSMLCRLQGDVIYHKTGMGGNNAVTLGFREA